MKKGILATKVGMTQIFNEDGTLVPVTVLQAGPCVVTQVKTVENDGYSAVQVGFVDKKEKAVNKDKAGKKEVIHRHGVNKALKGHFEKAGVSCKRYIREFRFENAESIHSEAKLKPICLQPEIRLMHLLFPKVRDSRAQSRDSVSTEVPWLMVPNSIVIRVPTVHVHHRAVYSKAKECPVTWAA